MRWCILHLGLPDKLQNQGRSLKRSEAPKQPTQYASLSCQRPKAGLRTSDHTLEDIIFHIPKAELKLEPATIAVLRRQTLDLLAEL